MPVKIDAGQFSLWHYRHLIIIIMTQHVVRTVRKLLRRRVSLIVGNNLHRNGETSRATGAEKYKDVYKKVIDGLHIMVQKDGHMDFVKKK